MILLVGCGNVLRRDDGAGPLLVRLVARRCRRPDLEIRIAHQLTPEIAEHLAAPEMKGAIFADACVSRSLPVLLPLGEERSDTPVGHHLSPASVLSLAFRLYGRRPPAWLVTVPGNDFGFGRGLSPAAREALVRAAEELLRHLDTFPLSPPTESRH